MLHEAVDVFALIVAMLGLWPLWRDQKRRLLATALACLLVAGAGYLASQYFAVKGKRVAAAERLAKNEDVIFDIVCRHPDGMNFDEIHQNIDPGSQDWRETDDAFGALVEEKRLKEESRTIVLPWTQKRPVPLRIWMVANPSRCKAQ